MTKGICEPAQKRGLAFAGGKFDLNKNATLPMSAFVDAMSSLARHIMDREDASEIAEEIDSAFTDTDDKLILVSALPGCEKLLFPDNFPLQNTRRLGAIGGKESIMRLQYAIRRLLKVICNNIKGVVLFVDDLQWSDVATIELLKSIALDPEIPSLLLVGAYRADEVSE